MTSADVEHWAVALHSRTGWGLTKESEAREQAAARLFAAHGLSPRRLAQGVDWFIDPWEGYGQPTLATVADMEVLGKELAKVHKMPIEWFDAFRAELQAEFPFLATVPANSHIWWYSCRMECMFPSKPDAEKPCDPVWLAEFAQPMFTPQSTAGARVVTCHGDLKEPNMVALAEGRAMQEGALKFVDLEFAHVTAACYDLAYVCFHYEDKRPSETEKAAYTYVDDVTAMRRAFLKAYLQAMGDASTKQDVDRLLVDVMLAACGHHFGPIGQCSPLGRELGPLQRFKEQAAALLASEAEQIRFDEAGPEGWLALQGYGDLLRSEVDEHVVEAFKFFQRIIAADAHAGAATSG